MEKFIKYKNAWRGLAIAFTNVCIFSALPALAASMYLTPSTNSLTVGQTFSISVMANSVDQSFNAAQATITYPKDVVQVDTLGSSGGNSVFDFWLEDPKFSNADGRITFLGGASNGISGANIPLLKISFIAKNIGQGNVAIADAAITASDGNGSNILTSVGGASFSVAPAQVAPPTSTPIVVPSTTVSEKVIPVASIVKAPVIQVVAPTIIKRKAEIVKNLPDMPKVTVGVYPDQTKWYGIISNFLAEWDLPLDISDVAVAVNKEYNFTPSGNSEGLIANKTFPAVEGDGIWYLHVRFKNNIGWGPVAHYKMALDTEPPLQLVVTSDDGLRTSNPSPIIRFKSGDGLSGITNYLIRVDGNEFVSTNENFYAIPLLDPGKHTITVRAVDGAGNMREYQTEIRIDPREAPLLVIGGVKINQFWFFTIFSGLLIVAFLAGWFFYRARNRQTSRKVVIAERDVMNLFGQIDKDVDKILQYYADNHIDEREATEMLVYIKKIKDNIQKSQKYIVSNIEEISE